ATNEHEKVNEASTKSDEHIHSGNEPDYLFYRELESADHEPLLSLPKFRGAEPKGESKGADQAIGNVQRSTFSDKTGETLEKVEYVPEETMISQFKRSMGLKNNRNLSLRALPMSPQSTITTNTLLA
ncbi:hypothetical protein Tco_1510632, partial [Tanacetum coccineum]